MAVSRSVLTIVGDIDRNVSLNFAVKGVMLREHQGPRPRQIFRRGKRQNTPPGNSRRPAAVAGGKSAVTSETTCQFQVPSLVGPGSEGGLAYFSDTCYDSLLSFQNRRFKPAPVFPEALLIPTRRLLGSELVVTWFAPS